MAFNAIPTLAGQAAIAAAIDPENPVPLVLDGMVVGDGNGNPIMPVETMTQLVNQRATVPLAAFTRDGNKLTIDAILDETIGGFTIREVGIVDTNGVLMFVASVPETEKIGASASVEDILTLGLIVVISDTANVILQSAGTTYATHDYVNQAIANLRTNIATPLQMYHITVKSMALAAAPVSPTPGDAYLIAADATGTWAGHSGQIAQYVGAATWIFVTPPNGFVVSNAADGLVYQKRGADWTPILPANAAGWLQNNGAGVKTWSDPFNIKGLASRDISKADLVPFHSTAIDGKRQTTVDNFAALISQSDDLFALMYFLGRV